jgi:nitroreductase
MIAHETETRMTTSSPEAMAFLLSRRSTPAKTLTTPVPDRAALRPILEAAARSPDHGKLEPWRFVVLERAALERLAAAVPQRGAALGIEPEKIGKMQNQFATAHLAVVVVARPRSAEKVPEIEQILSAGAVCTALLNAALASGWGANWLTGWAVHDRDFASRHLGIAEGEFVAGLIHIGTRTVAPPERPRPDLDAITTWLDA